MSSSVKVWEFSDIAGSRLPSWLVTVDDRDGAAVHSTPRDEGNRTENPPRQLGNNLLSNPAGLQELVAQYAPLELDGLSQAVRATGAQQRHAFSAAEQKSSAPAPTSKPQPVSAAQLEAQRRQSARAAFDLKLRQQSEAFRIKHQMQQETLRQQLQAEADKQPAMQPDPRPARTEHRHSAPSSTSKHKSRRDVNSSPAHSEGVSNRQPSKATAPPASTHPVPQAGGDAMQHAAEQPAGSSATLAYARPWRQNMKPAAQAQAQQVDNEHATTSSTASKESGPSKDQHAEQQVGLTRRAQQLAPEEYAKLQEFIKRKREDVKQQILDEKEAAVRTMKRRQAAAQSAAEKAREGARQASLSPPRRSPPRPPWFGVDDALQYADTDTPSQPDTSSAPVACPLPTKTARPRSSIIAHPVQQRERSPALTARGGLVGPGTPGWTPAQSTEAKNQLAAWYKDATACQLPPRKPPAQTDVSGKRKLRAAPKAEATQGAGHERKLPTPGTHRTSSPPRRKKPKTASPVPRVVQSKAKTRAASPAGHIAITAGASSSPAPEARVEDHVHGRISEATLQNLQLLNQLALQLQCQVQQHPPPRSISPTSCASPAVRDPWAQASPACTASHFITNDAARGGRTLHPDQGGARQTTHQAGASMDASCATAANIHPDHAAALMASWAAEEFQFPELSPADAHAAAHVPSGRPAGSAEADVAAPNTCAASANWQEGVPKQQPHMGAGNLAEGSTPLRPEEHQPLKALSDVCMMQTDSCALSSDARSHAASAAAHAAAAARSAALAAAQASSAATAAAAAAGGDGLHSEQAGSRVVPVMQLGVMGHTHAGAHFPDPPPGIKQTEDKSLQDTAHGSLPGTHDFRITAVYCKGDDGDYFSPHDQHRGPEDSGAQLAPGTASVTEGGEGASDAPDASTPPHHERLSVVEHPGVQLAGPLVHRTHSASGTDARQLRCGGGAQGSNQQAAGGGWAAVSGRIDHQPAEDFLGYSQPGSAVGDPLSFINLLAAQRASRGATNPLSIQPQREAGSATLVWLPTGDAVVMMGDAGAAQASAAEHVPRVRVEECQDRGAHEESLQERPASREQMDGHAAVNSMPTTGAVWQEASSLRLSPGALETAFKDGLKTLEDLGNYEVDLLVLEQSRRLSSVQQEAVRVAQMLEHHMAQQQQAVHVQAILEQQESNMLQAVQAAKREVREESLQQLVEVAALFAAKQNSSTATHAAVQVTEDDAPTQDTKQCSPGPPPRSSSFPLQDVSQDRQGAVAGQMSAPAPEYSASSPSRSLEPVLHPNRTTLPPAEVAGSIASSISTDSQASFWQGATLTRQAPECARSSDPYGSDILREEEEDEHEDEEEEEEGEDEEEEEGVLAAPAAMSTGSSQPGAAVGGTQSDPEDDASICDEAQQAPGSPSESELSVDDAYQGKTCSSVAASVQASILDSGGAAAHSASSSIVEELSEAAATQSVHHSFRSPRETYSADQSSEGALKGPPGGSGSSMEGSIPSKLEQLVQSRSLISAGVSYSPDFGNKESDLVDDDDDRKSERSSISLLSMDLEEQRQQLATMLAAKQKQLAHTRRQAALHAKKHLIQQMKEQVAELDRQIAKAVERDLPARSTFNDQQDGPAVASHHQQQGQRASTESIAEDSSIAEEHDDEADAVVEEVLPDTTSSYDGKEGAVSKGGYSSHTTSASSIEEVTQNSRPGQPGGHPLVANQELDQEHEAASARIRILQEEVVKKRAVARKLELQAAEAALQKELEALNSRINTTTTAILAAQVAPPAPPMPLAMPTAPPGAGTWAPSTARAPIPSATGSVYSEDFSGSSAAVDRTDAPDDEPSSVVEDDSLHIAASIPSTEISDDADTLPGSTRPVLPGVQQQQQLALSVSEEAQSASSQRALSGCNDGDVQHESGALLHTSDPLEQTTTEDIPSSPTEVGASRAAGSPAPTGPPSEASCSVEDLAAAEMGTCSDEERPPAGEEGQSEDGGGQYSSGSSVAEDDDPAAASIALLRNVSELLEEDAPDSMSGAEEVLDKAAGSQQQSTPAGGTSSDAALTSATSYSDRFSRASPLASADAAVEDAQLGATADERQEDAGGSSGEIAESLQGSAEDESYEEDFATDEAQPSSSQAAEASHTKQVPHQPSSELPADAMTSSEGGASLQEQESSRPASEAPFPAEQGSLQAAAGVPSTAGVELLGSHADAGHTLHSDAGDEGSDSGSAFSDDVLEEADAFGVQPEESWCSSPDAFAPQPLQMDEPAANTAVEESHGLLQAPASESIPAPLEESFVLVLPSAADHSASRQCSTEACEPAEQLVTCEYSADPAWSKQDEAAAAEGGGGHHDSSGAARVATEEETSLPEDAAELTSGMSAEPDPDERHHQQLEAAESVQCYRAADCGSNASSPPAGRAPDTSVEMDSRASQLEALQEGSVGVAAQMAAAEASKDTDVYSEESYSYASEDLEEMQLLAAQDMLHSGQDEAFDDVACLPLGSPAGSSADLAAIDAQFAPPSQETSRSSLHLAAAPAAPAQAADSMAGTSAQVAVVELTTAVPGTTRASADGSDEESADEVEDDFDSLLQLSQSEEEVFAVLEQDEAATPHDARSALLQPTAVQAGEAEPSLPHRALEDDGCIGGLGGAPVPTSSMQAASSQLEEAPLEETPLEETPLEEVPLEETPLEEVPLEETPLEELPLEETPLEEVPLEETPLEEVPLEETPLEEVPLEEAPLEEEPLEVHQGAEPPSHLPFSPDSAAQCSTAGNDSSTAPITAAPLKQHSPAAGKVGVASFATGPHEWAGNATRAPLGSSAGAADVSTGDSAAGARDAEPERMSAVDRVTDAIMDDLVQESIHEMTTAACSPSPHGLPESGLLTPTEHRGSQVMISAKVEMDYADAVSPPTGTGHGLVGAALDSPQPHSQESSPASDEGVSEEDLQLVLEAEQPSVSLSSDDFDAADIEPSSSDEDEDAFDPEAYVIPQQVEAAPVQLASIPNVEMDPSSIAAYVSDIMAGFTAVQPPLLLPGQDPLSLEGYLALERARPTVPDAQHIFNKLVYDAANEALLQIYTRANRLKVAGWLRKRLPIKPLPDAATLAENVKQQVLQWSAYQVKAESDLDRLLLSDAVADEASWSSFHEEEAVVKMAIADHIWEDLLAETAYLLEDMTWTLVAAGQPAS